MDFDSTDCSSEYITRGWWNNETFSSIFDRAVRSTPTAIALVDPPNREQLVFGTQQRYSYQELAHCADNLAGILYDHGLRNGDRVIVQLPNIAELIITYVALAQSGCIISPVPMQFGRFELAHVSAELKVDAVVTIGSFSGKPFLSDRIDAYPEQTRVFAFDAAGQQRVTELPQNRLDTIRQAKAPRPRLSANDILTICWTSGTTGLPKGVPRHHNHWNAHNIAIQDALPLKPGEAMLSPFPMTNMTGVAFLIYWPSVNARLILHHPFDQKLFFEQLETENVVMTLAPPSILNSFIKQTELHSATDLSSLKLIASGSAPLSPWMIRGYKEIFDVDIINMYGSSEGVVIISGPNDVEDSEQRACLFPRFGNPQYSWHNRYAARCATRLVDLQDRHTVIDTPGVPGELLMKGPGIFDGYLNSDGESGAVFDSNGYFYTGDIFEIAGTDDLEKYYQFVGRKKELIIRGGFNISPVELDLVLAGHPKILEAAVFGYPDEDLGEKVCAAVVPGEGEAIVLSDITSFLDKVGMAKFKWPEKLLILNALPRNSANKLMRNDLKKHL